MCSCQCWRLTWRPWGQLNLSEIGKQAMQSLQPCCAFAMPSHEFIGQLLCLTVLQLQMKRHTALCWERLHLGLSQLNQGTGQGGGHSWGWLFLSKALGVPISQLGLVCNVGFSLRGHLQHHLLVMAPGAFCHFQATSAVLRQLDRAVKHGLAELLQGHGSLWGGCHVKMVRLAVRQALDQGCGKFTGLMPGLLSCVGCVGVGLEPQCHGGFVVATTQASGAAIEQAVNHDAWKTVRIGPFADALAARGELRFNLCGGHKWLLFLRGGWCAVLRVNLH